MVDNIALVERPESALNGKENQDDEEALMMKWAALERLPTFERLRSSVLKKVSKSGRHVAHVDVDVRNIGVAERQQFIDQLLKVTEDDNYKFLAKLRARLDRVGIEIPTVEVRYENLTIDADAHFAGRALPSLPNTARNIIEAILEKIGIVLTQKVNLTILDNISGIVRPGRLTLLLGPPNSGKTTFLRALAGKFAKGLRVKGKVTYNGHDLGEFVPHKTSAYISQNDLHMAEMTVRETLDFSARCQGVGTRYETLFEVLHREKEAGILPEADIDFFMKATAVEGAKSSLITDYTLKILGLDICADIMVGDNMKRGISGGQKKRVTTGEIVVGPSKTLFMDEISNGLDTSTTFQITKCLQQYVHLMDATIVMSLLQPAPEIFELFDDVILLSEGQIVYQGPREFILQFFESCGFRCPERKGIGDFLQEVTSRKDQEQYWFNVRQPYSYITVRQFAEKFKEFHYGISLAAQLSRPFDRTKNHKAALVFHKYSISKWELLKANWEKEVLLMKRHSFVHIFKAFQIAIVAFIGGTVLFRTHMHQRNEQDGQLYLAALFFCLVIVMFNGFSELILTISRLSVFYKQRDLMFYPAWAYSIPSILLKVPLSLSDSFIFTLITYFTIGFAPEPNRFFKQYLIFFLEHQMSSSLFRAIAALSRTMIIANSGGTMSLLSIFVLGGYIIPRPKIPSWCIWGYWSSPLSYAQTAISVNEMQAPRWMEKNATQLDKNGVLLPLGVKVLRDRGLFTENYWYWASLGALLGFIMLFNVVYTLALTYLDPLNKPQANISKEQLEKWHAQAQAEPENLKSSTYTRPANVSENVNVELMVDGEPKRGMILPFTPLSMSFDEVEYSIDMPSEMKAQEIQKDQLVLLHGVTGAFRPNVLTALVGVSGAGKTTLMDVLAGRKTDGRIKGDICIAGFPKQQETFARISGYCEQNDIHSPQVTIYESLLFSAWLRLSADIKAHTAKVFVDEIMDLVELSPLRDALVGLPGVSGLSLEQRRRLSIAVELVANPSIIFMDEPTSGLDARAAAIVMRTVRNTVDTGRTVVCTIHQPSIDIFESFDELLLMKLGGQVIYAGPLGRHSHHLIDYFEAIPGVPPMKDGINPATWMLEISSQGAEARLGVDFAQIYRKSALYIRNKELVQQLSKPAPDSHDLSFPTQFSQPFLAQIQACLWKQFWTYWRSPGYNLGRFMFTFVSAILFGTIFWQVGHETSNQQDLFNVMGAMHGATMFLGINNNATVQPVVATERTVFYRERGAGFYSALAYGLAQVLIEIPFVLFQASYYALITYAMIGYEWEAGKFFWYFYVQFCTFLCFTYYGMTAVAITPNTQLASIVASPFFSIFFLFSGFVIPRPKIPKWWQWYYWLCPISWTLEGLITSQYGDLSSDLLIPGEGVKPVKQYLHEYFGFTQSFLPVIGVVLIVMPMLFACVVIVAFKKLNFQHR